MLLIRWLRKQDFLLRISTTFNNMQIGQDIITFFNLKNLSALIKGYNLWFFFFSLNIVLVAKSLICLIKIVSLS